MSDEPFYWTGKLDTRECGCIWHELLKTDGTGEPIWMGPFDSEICNGHRQRMIDRVRQLQAEGKLPSDEELRARHG